LKDSKIKSISSSRQQCKEEEDDEEEEEVVVEEEVEEVEEEEQEEQEEEQEEQEEKGEEEQEQEQEEQQEQQEEQQEEETAAAAPHTVCDLDRLKQVVVAQAEEGRDLCVAECEDNLGRLEVDGGIGQHVGLRVARHCHVHRHTQVWSSAKHSHIKEEN
jgi:hypothetical protein